MPSDLHARRLVVLLLVAAVALGTLLVSPFWQALFLAAVLAATLRRPMEWLAPRLPGRRTSAALGLTLLVLLVLVLPLAGLGAVLVQQVIEGVTWLRNAIQSEGIWGLVQRLPAELQGLVQRALAAIDNPQQQLQHWAGAQGGTAAAAVGGILAATGSALFQSVMMLIGLFFFLADGPRLVDWLDRNVPLRPGQFRALAGDFRRTSVSVLVATLATAAIQTVTSLVGYLIARAPNPLFLAVLTFVVALVPAAGATFAVVGVALLLLGTGHTGAGLFLLAWGVIVSLTDNLARPFLLKGGMELNGGVIFFALLGGVAVFGGIGLLVGPLVVTFLITAVKMYRREFGGPADEGIGPDAAAGAATAPPASGGPGPGPA